MSHDYFSVQEEAMSNIGLVGVLPAKDGNIELNPTSCDGDLDCLECVREQCPEKNDEKH